MLCAGMGCWSLTGGRSLSHEIGVRGHSGLIRSVGDWWNEKTFSARDGTAKAIGGYLNAGASIQ